MLAAVTLHRHFDFTLEGRVVVIRCYGTWDRSVGLEFLAALRDYLDEARLESPWATLVDFTQWRPATPDVVEIANDVRDCVDSAGRTHGAYFFGSLRVAELLVEKGVVDPASKRVQYFPDEEKSREWLGAEGYFGGDGQPVSG